MADVRIISSNIVNAANQRESSRIELTPWDLLLLPFPQIQKGLMFLKPKPHLQDKETLIHHLKTTLSHTLDHFPPLAGRLATTQHQDNTISYFIDCNNAGAMFVHATAETYTISDIIKPVYVSRDIVHSFFTLNGLKNHEGVCNPLLGIQVTVLADGIFIGCTMNHCVADVPIFQRWTPNGIHLPVHIPKSHLEQVYAKKLTSPPNDLQLQDRVFHFTRKNIAKLKAKANAEVEVGTNNNISSLQALLSHIWRSVVYNKRIDGDVETSFNITIGTRHRVEELPGNYFGNAMMGGRVRMKAKELLNEGIGNAAWQMKETVASVTEESVKKFLVSWVASPRLVTTDSAGRINNGLVISSSPRFNIYGNDFGWGKPVAVRNGLGNKCDGKITVFCGAEEGSIDVELCLVPETLEAMATDEEFMDTVTV
ncbi:Transferase [Corchorus olitorius]|uniref:Transferase n=1 Tax=Corchorus olitorius TaxID=93759 RepID=A0A1R3JBB7_9ROSI|nr:Transferase [Corchorus olitorius]